MSENGESWMQYMPDFMTPFGMVFYSLFVFILITIQGMVKRRTIVNYVEKTMTEGMQRSIIENRKRKSEEADAMLAGMSKIH